MDLKRKKNLRISIEERVKKEKFKARKEHHAHHCCLYYHGRPHAWKNSLIFFFPWM